MTQKLLKVLNLFSPLFFIFLTLGCPQKNSPQAQIKNSKQALQSKNYDVAYLAGGCFWCMEPPFDKTKGVIETVSGYMGGTRKSPTYKQVASGRTRHIESVKVVFDPKVVSYSKILEIFWMNVDPTDPGGQFVDRGPQYRTAIFYTNNEQKQIAQKSKENLNNQKLYNKPVITEIIKATPFYKAEEYHQNYYQKNPLRYKYYRHNSGRDQFLKKVWK